jgi:hypothetical protein
MKSQKVRVKLDIFIGIVIVRVDAPLQNQKICLENPKIKISNNPPY